MLIINDFQIFYYPFSNQIPKSSEVHGPSKYHPTPLDRRPLGLVHVIRIANRICWGPLTTGKAGWNPIVLRVLRKP